MLTNYWLSISIQIGIFAIAALGLNILVGFTGQISIGHAAFFLFGAFTSAYISNNLPIPVFFAIPLAGVVTALVGLIFGVPAARLKGLYLVIATLAAQYILLGFLLARRLVLRRLGAGQRQSVLDLRLRLPRRPAIFLRGAGLSRGHVFCW